MPVSHGKTSKKKTKSGHVRKLRTTSPPRKSSPKSGSHPKRKTAVKKDDVTYVYECTRPGCGYKIWRGDKGVPDGLRRDLKGPKSHHVEFGGFGKGDLPESFQVPVLTNPVHLEALRTLEIG